MRWYLKIAALLGVVIVVSTITIFRVIDRGPHPSGGQGELGDCPNTPNCFRTSVALRDDLNLQREYLLEILKRSRGMEVLIQRPDYIHATSRSRLFGFVDDFEAKLEQTPKGTFVHFRSASRVGYSDLGVNKKRILRIVNQLQEKNRLASDSLNEAL